MSRQSRLLPRPVPTELCQPVQGKSSGSIPLPLNNSSSPGVCSLMFSAGSGKGGILCKMAAWTSKFCCYTSRRSSLDDSCQWRLKMSHFGRQKCHTLRSSYFALFSSAPASWSSCRSQFVRQGQSGVLSQAV